MSDLLTRALTGTLFLAVMVGCIVLGELSVALIFLVISVIGTWEYFQLQDNLSKFKQFVGLVISLICFSSVFDKTGFGEVHIFSVVIILVLAMLTSVLLPKGREHLTAWAHVIFSQFYVTMPFLMLYHLAFLGFDYDYKVILTFFILLWLSDTGAYIFGKYLGKHKMIPKVSPKKTWEGLTGGIFCAIIGSAVLSNYGFNIPNIHWAAAAVLVSVLGAGGDLFESQMKRNKGVKDSGKLMPGHGGILDRFDGVLLSVPVIFALVKIIQ